MKKIILASYTLSMIIFSSIVIGFSYFTLLYFCFQIKKKIYFLF